MQFGVDIREKFTTEEHRISLKKYYAFSLSVQFRGESVVNTLSFFSCGAWLQPNTTGPRKIKKAS